MATPLLPQRRSVRHEFAGAHRRQMLQVDVLAQAPPLVLRDAETADEPSRSLDQNSASQAQAQAQPPAQHVAATAGALSPSQQPVRLDAATEDAQRRADFGAVTQPPPPPPSCWREQPMHGEIWQAARRSAQTASWRRA